MRSTRKFKILIVDDAPENIRVLLELLKNEYKVIVATNGFKALELAQREAQPDLILLDIMMPEMDGYEVCRRLKDNEITKNIPVIFVTAMKENEVEYLGLTLGAVDYLTKPIIPQITRARISNHLKLKQHQDNLEGLVQEKTKQLELTQSVMIESLGTLAEYRDPETGGHIKRTQNYMKAMVLHLRNHPAYHHLLSDEDVEMFYISAPLHDIGKVGVADSILLKPGKLTEEEFEEMKRHAEYGYETLKRAEIALGSDSFIRCAKEIAYSHHEKWDGSGYPNGLSGEDIPLAGRLMAVADVYDALISKRVYKEPFSHEKASSIIIEGRGRHFDPQLVDIFVQLESTFRNIAIQYADFDEEVKALGGDKGFIEKCSSKKIKKILVADDNEINLEVMLNQLQHMGFEVDGVENGREAYQKFQNCAYDLILTDLDMSVMNGYELARKIRKTDTQIPIIAITANIFDLSRERLSSLGFDELLLKPINEKRFHTIIKKICGGD